MEAIIYGSGVLPALLAPRLVEQGYQVTVVGSDVAELDAVYTEAQVNTVMVVDGFMQDYLQEADIAIAEIFVALSGDDCLNLLVSQTASHLFNVPKVVCRVDNAQLRRLYAEIGMTIVGFSDLDLFGQVQQAVNG